MYVKWKHIKVLRTHSKLSEFLFPLTVNITVLLVAVMQMHQFSKMYSNATWFSLLKPVIKGQIGIS